ncbi:type II secretion system protein [Catenovulum sp. 2E275]|uniref:type II secretion system protein n=1 Tax=Catenovulum sp. 2E275 TaxID=2980497 RepID=UPI00292A5120|nr:type II secretion system protein [Catenovulum sp. 2E275]
MKSSKGFTLIELIVVIVVLGILAVTAAPKFINIQDDAQEAVANGISASLTSAATMAHGKALIASQTGAEGSVSINGVSVALVNGYPSESSIGSLIEAVNGWPGTADATANTYTLAHSSGTCVVYTETSSSNTAPEVTVETCPDEDE